MGIGTISLNTKRTLILVALATFLAALLVMPAGIARAGEGNDGYNLEFKIKGEGVCQANGSLLITWNVKNKAEYTDLKITFSSNEGVVPKGTKIDANESMSFPQTVDGTQPGNHSLVLEGKWKYNGYVIDEDTERDTVKLEEACEQPAPTPPAGGQGSGVVQSAQVVAAPVGGVGAGSGSDSANLGALLGIAGSLGAVGFGLRSARKTQ